MLAFADSSQEAVFFAWYAEDSYAKLRDLNLMPGAMKAGPIDQEGLSIDDLRNRLFKQWEKADLFSGSRSHEDKNRQVLTSILREALTDERRLSLSGVGSVRWSVKIPDEVELPPAVGQPSWDLTEDETRHLIGYFMDELRVRRSMNLPEGPGLPVWSDASTRNQQAYGLGAPGNRKNVAEWGGTQSTIVNHFLRRLLTDSSLSNDEVRSVSKDIMKHVWNALRSRDGRHGKANKPILSRTKVNGTFHLNPRLLRIQMAEPYEIWECHTCASLTSITFATSVLGINVPET